METIKLINFIIATVFFVCYSYQFAYILVPYLKKEKPHKPAELHRYAVLISARNEELVIGNLLDSISAQDYPSSLVRVFVVADNCTDKTAKVARAHGAIVYERFNDKLVGKGYALEYLLDRIGEEYGDVFDAYMVFDADNLLSEDYISRMNETFSDGYRIITSYRNSKNYGDNWISAGYALWFLREAKYLNNARYLLGTSCAVSGTGFMFSREILKSCGGWPFHLLVEDIEFTIHNIVSGEKVGYCPRAVLYDEQPTKFSQSWKQRMRWARGYIQILRKYGGRLLHGIFAKRSFSCFDMTMNIAPAVILIVPRYNYKCWSGCLQRAQRRRNGRSASVVWAAYTQHLSYDVYYRSDNHDKRVEKHLLQHAEKDIVRIHFSAVHAHISADLHCSAVSPRQVGAHRS